MCIAEMPPYHAEHFRINGGIGEGVVAEVRMTDERREFLQCRALYLLLIDIEIWTAPVQYHRALAHFLNEELRSLIWLSLCRPAHR